MQMPIYVNLIKNLKTFFLSEQKAAFIGHIRHKWCLEINNPYDFPSPNKTQHSSFADSKGGGEVKFPNMNKNLTQTYVLITSQ